jgi:hypothetical protein
MNSLFVSSHIVGAVERKRQNAVARLLPHACIQTECKLESNSAWVRISDESAYKGEEQEKNKRRRGGDKNKCSIRVSSKGDI